MGRGIYRNIDDAASDFIWNSVCPCLLSLKKDQHQADPDGVGAGIPLVGRYWGTTDIIAEVGQALRESTGEKVHTRLSY